MSRRSRRNARARQHVNGNPVQQPAPEQQAAPAAVEETTFEVEVREPATAGEMQALFTLCLFHGEEMALAPVNRDKVAKHLDRAIRDDTAAILMAIKGQRAIGYLLLQKVDFWYSDESMLLDFGFYVLPAHRGTGVDKALLEAAEMIAESANLPLFISRLNTRRRGKVADLFGFIPMGSVLRLDRSPAPKRMN